MTLKIKNLVRSRLAGTRPPHDAVAEAAQRLRGLFPVDDWLKARPTRPAAVLIGLVERSTDLGILLTRRTDSLPDHPGQISFPGGRLEDKDRGPLEAALRETEEEIGLEPRFVEPVGYLPPHLTLTGYSVVPVVGLVRPGFNFRLDPKEVSELFELPMAFLMEPGNHQLETREVAGRSLALPVYHYGGYRIWGATAFMLHDFYRQLSGELVDKPHQAAS